MRRGWDCAFDRVDLAFGSTVGRQTLPHRRYGAPNCVESAISTVVSVIMMEFNTTISSAGSG